MTTLTARNAVCSMRSLLFILLVLTPAGLLAACSAGENPSPPAGTAQADSTATQTIDFRVDGQLRLVRDGQTLEQLDIEIADNDSSRARGLMQRNDLPEKSGMLFVFPDESERAFWMANTPLALDLLFIRADGSIHNIRRYVQPMSPENVTSDGPVMYVLELEAGQSDALGIVEGDTITWERRQDT